MMKGLVTVLTGVLMAGSLASATNVDFETFNIRNNNSTITAPWDSDMSIVENVNGDGFSAATPRSGQKVGYGTHAFDNVQINKIQSVNFTKISGKAGIVPYLNMWVTDGTNYAIISSENDYRGTDFAARQEWKVFEYNTTAGLSWLFDSGTGARDTAQYLTKNGVRVTLDEISNNIKLVSPAAPFPAYAGTGAPRAGYGFNVIFGDTQSNFIGSYALEDLSVTVDGVTYNAVPEPLTLALLGLGGLFFARKKK
jgi:hypothetical protein